MNRCCLSCPPDVTVESGRLSQLSPEGCAIIDGLLAYSDEMALAVRAPTPFPPPLTTAVAAMTLAAPSLQFPVEPEAVHSIQWPQEPDVSMPSPDLVGLLEGTNGPLPDVIPEWIDDYAQGRLGGMVYAPRAHAQPHLIPQAAIPPYILPSSPGMAMSWDAADFDAYMAELDAEEEGRFEWSSYGDGEC